MTREAVFVRPTAPADIAYVLDNLWQRGVAENDRIGLTDREKLKERLLEKPLDYISTIWAGDNPVAFMGASQNPRDGIFYTWFMATDKFTEHSLSVTKLVSRFIKDNIGKEPGCRLELWSASDHPMAERWFGVLGFARLPEKRNGCVAYLYKKCS